MNDSQTPSYRNRKKNGKKKLKRTLAMISAGVALGGAGVASLVPQVPWNQGVVKANEIQHGRQIGTLNGVPVVQANTADMSSPEFQGLVDSLLEGKDLSGVKYIADQIQWNANTQVKGVNGVQTGTLHNVFGTNISHFLQQDGFVKEDTGAYLNPGQSLAVTNVGTVTDLETGEKIPVDLIITHVDVERGNDGWSNKNVAMAIKNQGSVITVGVVTPTGSGNFSSTGGQTEAGSGGGGQAGTGLGAGYIERVTYVAGLVRQDTKQAIPNEQILMAMKVSDIDARQLATLGSQGALGYIVGSNTDLSISGGGLVSGTATAVNNDSTQLLPTAYTVLKQWNSNSVSYRYMDGQGNHFDIVTGLFGNMGFKLNADSKGSVTIQKTGTASGTSMWNTLYTLEGNVFRLTNRETGVTFEGTTDEKGSVTLTDIPFGNYTVEEISSSPGFHKTFAPQDITLSAQTPKATVNGKEDQLITVNGTNDEITGKIKVVKKGTESQLALWNQYYSLLGNRFKLTNKQSGKVYEVTTDAKGEALVENMQLGDYTVEEISASAGFAKTFKNQSASLKQDGTLEITVSGTNDEIKGENTLEKRDKDTATASQGQGILKQAEYTLYYAEDTTGSASHQKDTPVKWTDIPNAKLLKGKKVKTSIINGKEVDNGENIVLNVDDKDLTVAVGNLALGKYYWKESNAPEGYAIDGKKHPFTIAKKDDATKNIVTPRTKSLEQIIKAKISIQKIVQSKGDGSHSGINDVTFKATPINDTKAEALEFTTTIKEDEDGFATTELLYGDWKIEEVEAPAGYEKIAPIYIHMSYDEKTDLYTITASKHKDGSQPFSSRTFSQSDDQPEKNGHVKGTLAGTLTSTNALISLSRMTFKDNPIPELTPEEPTFQPEKFDLSEAKFDLTGEKLMDDDDELADEYTETNKDPYVDKVDNNEPQNLNTKLVKRGNTLFYQVWLDTTHFTPEQLIQSTGLTDRYDAQRLTLDVKSIKGYDGKTGEEVTQLFDITDKDGKLTIQTKKELVKDGILDLDRLAFGRYYKFDLPATVKDDVEAGADIENTASQFVTIANPKTPSDGEETEGTPPEKTLEKPTQKRVNKVKEVEEPTFQPEKFDLSEAKFDLTGEKLMDDDDELTDEYGETNKDPYVDKVDNNEPQNLNTKLVKRGDKIFYQVWLDTTHFTPDQLIQAIGLTDRYDAQRLTLDVKSIKGYDGKTGEEVTQLFDITDKDGKLTIQTKKELVKDGILDLDRLAFGRYYKFDIPATVKDDVEAGADIENTASQFVTTMNPKTKEPNKPVEKPTQKRVNKVKQLKPEPHKFVLDKAAVDVKGTKLLDDDSELKDRYQETNKDPYVDQTKNNEPENINTAVVKAGTVLHYQVWMDTTPFDKDSLLQTSSIEDDYDERYVTIDPTAVKVYNKATGKEVTQQFTITDQNGKLSIEPNDSVKKTLGQIKVLDTAKFDLGVYYQVEIPATVKKDVAAGVDITNTAKQIIVNQDGKKEELITEKRVNKTPQEAKPGGFLPRTGEGGTILYTLLGGLLFGTLLEWRTGFLRKHLQKALNRSSK
ncbi:SspB-related isopeptide-forming adhesin [Streptococcus acidominimus]|uniref:SspB-related isopeptide-forming adhesin n=1 Tax=Streptococcus acidominimus TaxID=1326 RepID=UPI001F57A06D|nr:SspB-related isopeptide-forming adhesin [Streptococcus acidominimus]